MIPRWLTPELLEQAKAAARRYHAHLPSGTIVAKDFEAEYEQKEFRFGVAGSSLSAPTWEAAESTDLTLQEDGLGNYALQMWIVVAQVQGNADLGRTEGFRLQVQKNGAGGYDYVDNVNYVNMVADSGFADGDPISSAQVGTGGGWGSYISGEAQETNDLSDTITFTQDVATYTNLCWSVEIVDANMADGDFLEFRVVEDDGTVMQNDATSDKPRLDWDATGLALVRVIDERLDLGEAVARARALVRVRDEPVNVPEGAVRFRARVRVAATEVMDLVEGLVHMVGKVQVPTTEAMNLTEPTPVRSRVLVRVRDEAMNLVDGVARSRVIARVADEVLNLAETVRAVRLEPLALVDSVHVSAGGEATTRQLTIPAGKVAGDFAAPPDGLIDDQNPHDAIDFAANRFAEFEVSVQATSIAESGWDGELKLTDGGTDLDAYTATPHFSVSVSGLVRVIDEALNLQEGVVRARTLARTVAETLNLPEAIAYAEVLVRVLAESVSVPENVVRSRALARSVAEVLNLPEVLVRFRRRCQSVGETLNIVEGVIEVLGKVQVVTEILNLTEGVARHRALARAVAEVLTLPEVITTALARVRVLSGVLNVPEALSRARALSRTRDEALTLPEALARRRALVRAESEALNIPEDVNYARGLFKVIDETLHIIEDTHHVLALLVVRVINETVHLAETLAQTSLLCRVADEAVNLSEAVPVRVRGLARSVAESLTLAEGTVTQRALVRALDEALSLAEAPVKAMRLIRVRAESVTLPENAVRAQILLRVVSEVMNVAEGTVRRLAGIIVSLIFTLIDTIPRLGVDRFETRERLGLSKLDTKPKLGLDEEGSD